ncbi:hypothetical protein Cni_G19616 [Canna indica]|uniref:Uncharacterized protein n=1 Tax=Canna indica TaxID=4628 RepID=A0AAQ3KKX1_9LILI|nr:hypothetical protein Cni_G19616 [Canna indica]
MGHGSAPFSGIIKDIQGRGSCYKQDWIGGLHTVVRERSNQNLFLFFRILAPTMYVFFASALPVIAFGEQLSKDTGLYFFDHSVASQLAQQKEFNLKNGKMEEVFMQMDKGNKTDSVNKELKKLFGLTSKE